MICLFNFTSSVSKAWFDPLCPWFSYSSFFHAPFRLLPRPFDVCTVSMWLLFVFLSFSDYIIDAEETLIFLKKRLKI